MEKTSRITKQRRKWLRQQLKKQMGNYKFAIYKASLLNWGQFLMRLCSFGIIAYAFEQVYTHQTIPLGFLAGLLIGLNGVGLCLGMCAKKYQGEASRYARDQLKKQFFEAFLDHELFFSKPSFVDIVTVATQGIDSLDTFYQQYLMTTTRVKLNCVTIWLVLFYVFPFGSMLFLLSVPFIPLSILLIQKRSQQIMQHYWATYMDVGNMFMDDLRGMNTLYSYQADALYEQTFIQKAEEFRLSTMELLKFQLQSVGYMDAIMYIGISLSGFSAILQVGQGNMTLAIFLFVLLVSAEFFAPIRELGYCMHLLMMNIKMADRIFSFLEVAKGKQVEEGSLSLTPLSLIQLQEIVIQYANSACLLAPITARFEKGNMIAIAGESGVGKTSLARVLMKQLLPKSGRILIDGIELTDWNQEEWSQQVIYVSPNSYIFNSTILENLTVATSKSEEDIRQWLQTHQLLNVIDELPQGIHSPVGEDGQLLSPGQRQQLLVARTLLSDRAIYIFDEMTSSVDPQVERAILEAIQEKKSTAIILWISHKMKEVAQADQVLFIEKNQTIQETPQVLYHINETYRNFVETQRELEEMVHGIL